MVASSAPTLAALVLLACFRMAWTQRRHVSAALSSGRSLSGPHSSGNHFLESDHDYMSQSVSQGLALHLAAHVEGARKTGSRAPAEKRKKYSGCIACFTGACAARSPSTTPPFHTRKPPNAAGTSVRGHKWRNSANLCRHARRMSAITCAGSVCC